MRDLTIASALVAATCLAADAAAQPSTADVTATTEPAAAPSSLTEPRQKTIDLGAFLGINAFGDDIELGNAWAPEQVPGTALVLGGRAGVTLLPDLAKGSALDPQLGVEGELKLALASTGESMEGGRDAYFAPVFGWRAHAILRLRMTGRWHPHLVVGAGGESVLSSSPFMGDDTDAAFHWGPGVTWRASDKIVARADLRHGVTAGRDDDLTSTVELHVGIERSFDFGGRTVEQLPPPPPPDTDGDGIVDPEDACPTEPETMNGFEDGDGCPDALDTDGDGLKDPEDTCPVEPEDVDGFQDDDGCPEADNDGDGVLDAADACALDAEDLDQFDDADGCPDLDNDGDGVEDRADGCPLEPETANGFQDADGCPDELPKVVKQFTGVIEGITFEYSRARIQKKSFKVLNKAAEVLREYPDLRVRIEGHTDDRGVYEKNMSLSQRRAEAVKWYLVDQGIAADRIETVGYGPDKPRASNKKKKGRAQNRRIEFHLIVGGATPAPPTSGDAAATPDGAAPAPAPSEPAPKPAPAEPAPAEPAPAPAPAEPAPKPAETPAPAKP